MALRWNYTLGTGELMSSTAWELDGTQIVFVFVTGVTKIKDDRFDVDKSEVATLIIKNVSELEDGTFLCTVQTDEGGWKYKIRLEITGEKCRSDTRMAHFEMCIHLGRSWHML